MPRSPWELILTEPVPEEVEFRSVDWAEKYLSAQSARSSSWVTLSLSYTKQFSSSIDLVAWHVQREGCRGEFQKKIFNEAEEITSLTMGARNHYSSINFLDGFSESISAEKIDGRVLIPSPHVKACDFLGFVEYFFF